MQQPSTFFLAILTLSGLFLIGCGPSSSPPAKETLSTTTAQSAVSEPAPPAVSEQPAQKVVLGSPELTAGIPGEGPLTAVQIQKWLDESRNHEPLQLELPLGLNVLPNRLQKLTQPMTRAKIELGRQLFFDTRLSADNTVSCASCHDPDHGYTVTQRFATGIKGQSGTRNPPTLFNRIMFGGIGEEEFWDGHAATIEDAILVAITDPTEMGNSLEGLMKTLRRTPGYRLQFEKIYGKVHIAAVGDAVASFVRCLVISPSPFDYYRAYEPFLRDDPEVLKKDDPELFAKYQKARGEMEAHPLSEPAQRGMQHFFGDEAWCSMCHATPAFTDNLYHNIGIGMDAERPDLGRYLVTGDDKDRGAFKTPPVRNAVMTAPYMHDGSLATLEDVVEWYAQGGRENPNLSDKFRRIPRLNKQQKMELVEFIKACSGELPKVERKRLPE